MTKGHFREKYPYKGTWTENFKPLFEEIYGWCPDEFYNDYLKGLFSKLLEIYLKIQDDRSGSNIQLKEIIGASFCKTISRDQELPIERVIAELCGHIQCSQVIEYGVNRYYLDLKKEEN
jgi:hypothetical protein